MAFELKRLVLCLAFFVPGCASNPVPSSTFPGYKGSFKRECIEDFEYIAKKFGLPIPDLRILKLREDGRSRVDLPGAPDSGEGLFYFPGDTPSNDRYVLHWKRVLSRVPPHGYRESELHARHIRRSERGSRLHGRLHIAQLANGFDAKHWEMRVLDKNIFGWKETREFEKERGRVEKED